MTATMTDAERAALAAALYNNIYKFLNELYKRWLSDSKFEEISNYEVLIRPEVEKIGGTLVTMHKRPFGFTFALGGAEYRIMLTTREYDYARTK